MRDERLTIVRGNTPAHLSRALRLSGCLHPPPQDCWLVDPSADKVRSQQSRMGEAEDGDGGGGLAEGSPASAEERRASRPPPSGLLAGIPRRTRSATPSRPTVEGGRRVTREWPGKRKTRSAIAAGNRHRDNGEEDTQLERSGRGGMGSWDENHRHLIEILSVPSNDLSKKGGGGFADEVIAAG